jgi:hypothetical protein
MAGSEAVNDIKESPAQASAVSERANFVCDCSEEARPACAEERFYKEHEGKRYCVLHYPGKEKSADFDEALRKKREAGDSNFRGVWFPGVAKFAGVEFSSDANFEEAMFTEGADFSRATFHARANFVNAIFAKGGVDGYSAHFYSATFHKNGDFFWAEFRGRATFDSATFSAWADFNEVKFSAKVKFNSATFSDYARFSEVKFLCGDKSWMDFRGARIEKPGGIAFHTTTLRPHWFVSVDARKFEFTNVDWNWPHISIKREIEGLNRKEVASPYRLLSIACRMLAVNAEENHRYDEASKFRYWSMNVRRKEEWWGFAPWKLDWWYWLASGYGERMAKAFLVLLGLWLLFAALFHFFGVFDPSLPRPVSVVYSLGVMLLQKPDPKATSVVTNSLVYVETILGPVQAALLALAVRRKFMR